jgi:hypothetical protein
VQPSEVRSALIESIQASTEAVVAEGQDKWCVDFTSNVYVHDLVAQIKDARAWADSKGMDISEISDIARELLTNENFAGRIVPERDEFFLPEPERTAHYAIYRNLAYLHELCGEPVFEADEETRHRYDSRPRVKDVLVHQSDPKSGYTNFRG